MPSIDHTPTAGDLAAGFLGWLSITLSGFRVQTPPVACQHCFLGPALFSSVAACYADAIYRTDADAIYRTDAEPPYAKMMLFGVTISKSGNVRDGDALVLDSSGRAYGWTFPE